MYARWVPNTLTNIHKHVKAGQKFLQCFKNETEEVFSHLVTGDETWDFLMNAESKKTLLKANTFKQAPSTLKTMANIFWDKKECCL